MKKMEMDMVKYGVAVMMIYKRAFYKQISLVVLQVIF